MKTFVILGAILGGLSVAAGAFGAHALRAQLEPRMLEVFETAALTAGANAPGAVSRS